MPITSSVPAWLIIFPFVVGAGAFIWAARCYIRGLRIRTASPRQSNRLYLLALTWTGCGAVLILVTIWPSLMTRFAS